LNHAVFRRESFVTNFSVDWWLSPLTNPLRLSAGRASRSIMTLAFPVNHTVPPRVFQTRSRARRQLSKEPSSGFPHNPEPILRSPVKAHGLKAQNAFDWFDPRLSTRSGLSVKFMNENNLKAVAPLPLASAPRLSRWWDACSNCLHPLHGRSSLRRTVRDPDEERCLSPISATNFMSMSTPETHQLSRARLSPH